MVTCLCALSTGMEVVDFSLYPDREYQLAWLRTFLELTLAERGRPASDVTDVDVERLYVQVNKFSLVRLGFLSLFFFTSVQASVFVEQIWCIFFPGIVADSQTYFEFCVIFLSSVGQLWVTLVFYCTDA